MKKLMSIILASAVTASMAMPVFAADKFKDVNSKNYAWAYDYVEDMAEKGLIKGYEDGTFKPEKSVSRMEAFALFARLMGSNSELNADFLEEAKQTYAEVLKPYELSYAEGDVAFMLARGVLEEDELDTYFKGNLKSEAMPRSEAAILITKAMLSEQNAKNEVLIDMDYTDVASIPKAAKQYVYFVTQKGIMSGMGDGKFSPNTAVLRGQIAVMLSKTFDTINYSFEEATLVSIDVSKKNIKIKDADGQTFTIGYSDAARFFKKGAMIVPSNLKAGAKIVFTYVADDENTVLAFADVKTNAGLAVDKTIKVVYKGYQSKGGIVMMTTLDPATDSQEAYPCDSAMEIEINGEESNVNKLNIGDYVEISLIDDTVVKVSAMQKNATVDAVIEKVGTMGTITISSDDEEFDGMTLSFADDALFMKNNDTADFTALGRGDKVKLTLKYGLVTKAVISSATKTVTGTLVSYTIAGTPTVTINRDGTTFVYDLSPNATVTINGEEAKLYDFAIGANLTVTVESDVVKKIVATDATSTVTSGSVSGIVTGIYDKNIAIMSADTNATINITCTTATKVVSIPSLNSYELKKIKAGDVITAYGAYKNGIFVCSGITVAPSSN